LKAKFGAVARTFGRIGIICVKGFVMLLFLFPMRPFRRRKTNSLEDS